MSAGTGPRIAYLSSEVAALSTTFVYEEIHALERRGWTVLPFGVRAPAAPAAGQAALDARTRMIYDRGPLGVAWRGLRQLFSSGLDRGRAGAWLWADMRAVGLHRAEAWKLAYQWLAAVPVALALRQQGCRLLHIHFAHVPAQIGMYAAAMARVPFTITAHANDLFERGLLLQAKAERSARFITISGYNLAFLQDRQLPSARLALVRCGVALAAAPARPARDGAGRVAVIGTLGRLVEKKGMDTLLQAQALLLAQGCETELQVVGDGPLAEALKAQAEALGLGPRVRFLGALSHSAVAQWLAGIDLFALACRRDAQGDQDGIPVVLMEAMSQGVPVVSTRLSGIPELVVDGDTGLLAPPADPAELARQLTRLIEDPELAARLARAAQAHVHAEFGQDVNIDRLEAIFQSAIKEYQA